jgi:hypothetical protein
LTGTVGERGREGGREVRRRKMRGRGCRKPSCSCITLALCSRLPVHPALQDAFFASVEELVNPALKASWEEGRRNEGRERGGEQGGAQAEEELVDPALKMRGGEMEGEELKWGERRGKGRRLWVVACFGVGRLGAGMISHPLDCPLLLPPHTLPRPPHTLVLLSSACF